MFILLNNYCCNQLSRACDNHNMVKLYCGFEVTIYFKHTKTYNPCQEQTTRAVIYLDLGLFVFLSHLSSLHYIILKCMIQINRKSSRSIYMYMKPGYVVIVHCCFVNYVRNVDIQGVVVLF